MKAVYAIKCIYTPLWKGVSFVLKDFDQSQELKTITKKTLQFYMFPTKDFFVIQTETRFCYMEDGWKVRINIRTALWSFVNFCFFSQSEVSTDNRQVSTFFAFQHERCRCCYRSYLERFLITSRGTPCVFFVPASVATVTLATNHKYPLSQWSLVLLIFHRSCITSNVAIPS